MELHNRGFRLCGDSAPFFFGKPVGQGHTGTKQLGDIGMWAVRVEWAVIQWQLEA